VTRLLRHLRRVRRARAITAPAVAFICERGPERVLRPVPRDVVVRLAVLTNAEIDALPDL
jgi:hypothetical protein